MKQILRAPCPKCRAITEQQIEDERVEWRPCCDNPAHEYKEEIEHAWFCTRCGICGAAARLYRRFWPGTENVYCWSNDARGMYWQTGEAPYVDRELTWDGVDIF